MNLAYWILGVMILGNLIAFALVFYGDISYLKDNPSYKIPRTYRLLVGAYLAWFLIFLTAGAIIYIGAPHVAWYWEIIGSAFLCYVAIKLSRWAWTKLDFQQSNEKQHGFRMARA